MRLTRRALLIGGGAAGVAGLGLAGSALAQRPQALAEPTPLTVRATPIGHLDSDDPNAERFGALRFRSGLDLTSSIGAFGGLSGLSRSPDGRDLIAIADNAHWFTARILTEDGRLTGLGDAVLAPILDANGRSLRRTRYYDTEGLTLSGGTAFVAIERNHAVMRFD